MLPSGGCGRSNVLVTSSRAATLVRSTTSVPVPVGAGFRLARTPKGSANCGRRLARPYFGLPKTHTRNGPLLPSRKCTPSPVALNITWRRALSSPHAIVNALDKKHTEGNNSLLNILLRTPATGRAARWPSPNFGLASQAPDARPMPQPGYTVWICWTHEGALDV